RFNNFNIQTVNETSAHFSRAGQFVIVRVQKFVEENKLPDLHNLGKLFVDLPDFPEDQFLHGFLLGQVHVGGIGNHSFFRPVTDIAQIDIDDGGNIGTRFSKGDRFLDIG